MHTSGPEAGGLPHVFKDVSVQSNAPPSGKSALVTGAVGQGTAFSLPKGVQPESMYPGLYEYPGEELDEELLATVGGAGGGVLNGIELDVRCAASLSRPFIALSLYTPG